MSQPYWKGLQQRKAYLPTEYASELTRADLHKTAEQLDRNARHQAHAAHGPYLPEHVHRFVPEELAKYRKVFDDATRVSLPAELRIDNELTNAQQEEVREAQATKTAQDRITVLHDAARLRIPLPEGMNPFSAEGRMHLERGAQEMYRKRFDARLLRWCDQVRSIFCCHDIRKCFYHGRNK